MNDIYTQTQYSNKIANLKDVRWWKNLSWGSEEKKEIGLHPYCRMLGNIACLVFHPFMKY